MLRAAIELVLVENPVRRRFLRTTMDWFFAAAGRPALGRVLEVGSGNGDGIEAIERRFRPGAIHGLDVDPAQIERAKKRLHGKRNGSPAPELWVGDAARLPFPDASYDALFQFNCLHHVATWETALDEVRRVLKPGGLYFYEVLSREYFERLWLLGRLLQRNVLAPGRTVFGWGEFDAALEARGFRTLASRSRRVPGWHDGVARR
ncbi:MAG TPA: class I SAM-dependent methyltransferase [Planctomycetota bacterium]|nr:class I SAM-dependent methyltransferase [Planctomycetota bacterium]